MDRAFRTRFLLVIATVIGVIALMTATSVLALRTTKHQLEEAKRIDHRLIAIDRLRAQARELGLSARRFVLTGDQKEQQRVLAIIHDMNRHRKQLGLRAAVEKGGVLEADLDEYIAALVNTMSFDDDDPIVKISHFEDELARIRAPIQMTFDEVVAGEHERRESLRSARTIARAAQWGLGAAGALTIVIVAGLGIGVLRRARSQDIEQIARSREELVAASSLLRSPLEAVIAEASKLRLMMAHSGQLRAVETIGRNASRVNGLLAELLDVTALQTGATSLRPEAIDAAVLLDRVVKDHRDEAHARGVRLRYEAQLAIGAFADRERIRHVLDTLVDVALVGTQPGAELVVHVGSTGDEVRFAVIEAGTRFDESASESELPIRLCSRVVEAHGGRLGIQASAIGRTYWFTLPTARTVFT